MDEKNAGREWFYSQGKLPIPECDTQGKFEAYRLKHTYQDIFEFRINSGLGGKSVEIDQITDIHLNYVGIDDEGDKELEGTKAVRTWNKEGESVKSVIRAMDVAKYADQTIITGDVLDYLSIGSLKLMKKHILDRDSNVMVTLGGHELTKQMQTNLPDRLTLEERYAILREYWPHDMFYHSKVVGGKVIAVALDNSLGQFCEYQIEKLKADIEKARAEKKIILLFMHEPIATGTNTGEVPANWVMKGSHPHFDFDGETTIGAKPNDTEVTRLVYSMITENADVIKGIFCGHRHSLFCVDIAASYTDCEGRHDTTIPQFLLRGNPYLGHIAAVARIIVD